MYVADNTSIAQFLVKKRNAKGKAQGLKRQFKLCETINPCAISHCFLT